MPSMSVGGEAGVLDGGEARVERELERVAEQPAADLGLPDAADARRAARSGRSTAITSRRLEQRDPHDSSPSSCCSNVTCTGMPIAHVVGRAVHDVRREPQARPARAISTIATTYGSSGPGIHGWWLTENVCTVARPDTASTARSLRVALRADAASAGGRSSRSPGSAGTAARRRAPPVQKCRFRSVTRGRIRNGTSVRSSSSSSGFGRGVEARAGVRDRLDRGQQPEPGQREHDRAEDLVPASRRPPAPAWRGGARRPGCAGSPCTPGG